MSSLILLAITIATLAALSVAAINYTPWWIQNAQVSYDLAEKGFARLERAYELATASSPDETPPVPSNEADGGMRSLLATHYGFLPKAPKSMAWVYGHQSSGHYAGLDYFCVRGAQVDEGTYRGLARLAKTLGATQAVMTIGCAGATASTPSGFPAPAAMTYYVQYVPEVQ